ncbi:enoyl-CoA hydratase/isomerase family protein [Aquipuribacter sp. SD81]|uniref:enoyl-CoA hydratase/isomerase family protein n=1 Tax=Aquipuribacter sp. SD81 TaxID=3127703 RepID=UPI00301A82E0
MSGVVLERPRPEVLRVVLDRPQRRNAQTPSTWSALAEAAHTLPPEVRVVVVAGRGESFSSGLDRAVWPELTALAALPDAELDARIEGYQRGFTGWRRPGVLSVAAVQGHAVGAGFQLALACDVRVAADDARFRMAETSLGLVPDLAGTAPLVRAVGEAAALELCLTGREVGAAEARALGLVQLVVPRDDLDAAVDDLVEAVLAAPAGASRETLDLLRGAADRAAPEQLRLERAAQARRLRSLVARPEAAGEAGAGRDG